MHRVRMSIPDRVGNTISIERISLSSERTRRGSLPKPARSHAEHYWDTPLLYLAPIESATRPMLASRVVLLIRDFP